MLERINPQSGVAIFAQIENEVRFAIASGELKANGRLPAVHDVADRLNVTTTTVAKAYREMEIMGLVYTRFGMGVFIKDGVKEKCQAECYREIICKMHEVVTEAKAAGFKEAEVNALAKKCFASMTSPYGVPPAAVLAMVKGKK